jgi:hypothetical protein
MKNERQRTDMEFDQLLSKAVEFEVDEERLMRRVHSRLNNPTYTTGIAQMLQALLMRWPATTATACLLAAFSIGLFFPINLAHQDEANVIAFAFGDPTALASSGHILQPSFWR